MMHVVYNSPTPNPNLCKFSEDNAEEPDANEEEEYYKIDMDKYILKSKLKTLDLPDKTKYLKSKIELQSPTTTTELTTTTNATENELKYNNTPGKNQTNTK